MLCIYSDCQAAKDFYCRACSFRSSFSPPTETNKHLPRFKPEMWAKVAEEMAVPWRAAEAMHWQLGEADMARRAGVVPFSLSSSAVEQPPSSHRSSPSRGHAHSHSHSQLHGQVSAPPQSTSVQSPPSRFPAPGRGIHSPAGPGPARSLAARRESLPRSAPPGPAQPPSQSPSSGGVVLAGIGPMGMARGGCSGQGGGNLSATLPPMQPMLPSVAEMTTGMSLYNTPAYSVSSSMSGGYTSSGLPGPMMGFPGVARVSGGNLGVTTGYGRGGSGTTESGKRRKSPPDVGQRETTRRRH
jgi:hypothetical protein